MSSSARTSRHRSPASARTGHAPPSPMRGSETTPSRRGVPGLLAGAALAVLVLVIGAVAKIGPVASLDLRADRHIAEHDRSHLLTVLAKAVTVTATPETIGVGLMILIPLVLLLARRRLDALRVFFVFAGAFALAEVGKKLIGEHRPPVSLWAMKADSGASYPSGHVTTAAALVAALVLIAATARWRRSAVVLGTLYVLAVAASRVYLADHYPVDVLGSVLCALAAGFVVAGLSALPVLQPYLRRIDRRGGRRDAPS